jgi:hypothetical protein
MYTHTHTHTHTLYTHTHIIYMYMYIYIICKYTHTSGKGVLYQNATSVPLTKQTQSISWTGDTKCHHIAFVFA